MKYQKRLTCIEAVQFLGVEDGVAKWDEAPEWLIAATKKGIREQDSIHIGEHDPHEGYTIPVPAAYIKNPGHQMALKGDYIVRSDGRLTVIKGGVFESAYEIAP